MIINALVGAFTDDKVNLFSGGWDKMVKKWVIDKDKIESISSCDVGYTINSLVLSPTGILYAAGENGNIVQIDAK